MFVALPIARKEMKYNREIEKDDAELEVVGSCKLLGEMA